MDFYSQKNKLNQRKTGGSEDKIPQLNGLKKKGIEKYEDPTGEFSNRQLNFSAWYVKNRILVYRFFVSLLISFSVITILYSLLRVAWIIVVEIPRDKKIMEQLASPYDYQQLNRILAPQNILIDEIQVFLAGVGKYDVMTEISNPNTKHIIYFDYYFLVNGASTTKKSAFILPLQTKPVLEYGLNDAYGIELIIENYSAKRINAHIYPDPTNHILARDIFSLENFEFKSVLHPEGANANIVKFSLINSSPFHYYNPEFIVKYKNNGLTVGVASIVLENFISLQTREVDLRSFADNLFINELEIVPSINYFDQSSYFEPIR